jgi:hypothetical protein
VQTLVKRAVGCSARCRQAQCREGRPQRLHGGQWRWRCGREREAPKNVKAARTGLGGASFRYCTKKPTKLLRSRSTLHASTRRSRPCLRTCSRCSTAAPCGRRLLHPPFCAATADVRLLCPARALPPLHLSASALGSPMSAP